MVHIFREINILKQKGKLHTKLLRRTHILFIISAILLGIIIYNFIVRDIDIFWAGGLSFIGCILGVFVFSQMNVVDWNEEEEILKSGKMDTLGFIALGLYIVFEIGLRTFLTKYFPANVIPLLICGIFGTLLGRGIGTIIEIHRVYKQNQPNSEK